MRTGLLTNSASAGTNIVAKTADTGTATAPTNAGIATANVRIAARKVLRASAAKTKLDHGVKRPKINGMTLVEPQPLIMKKVARKIAIMKPGAMKSIASVTARKDSRRVIVRRRSKRMERASRTETGLPVPSSPRNSAATAADKHCFVPAMPAAANRTVSIAAALRDGWASDRFAAERS